jgi:hypothetical protein
MSPETLDVGDSNPLRQMKLIEEEQYLCVAPSVAPDACAPVDCTELTASNVPLVVLGVAVGVFKALIIVGPVRNLLLIE